MAYVRFYWLFLFSFFLLHSLYPTPWFHDTIKNLGKHVSSSPTPLTGCNYNFAKVVLPHFFNLILSKENSIVPLFDAFVLPKSLLFFYLFRANLCMSPSSISATQFLYKLPYALNLSVLSLSNYIWKVFLILYFC